MGIEKLLNIGKGAVTGLCLFLAGNSLAPVYAVEPPAKIVPSVDRKVERDYLIGDFKKVYGRNAWNSLNEEKRRNIEKGWKGLDITKRKQACESYDDVLKYAETHLTKEQQKEFNNLHNAYLYFLRKSQEENRGKNDVKLFKGNVDKKALKKEYEKHSPWVDFENPGHDLLWIYMNEAGKGRLNPDLLKRKYCLPY